MPVCVAHGDSVVFAAKLKYMVRQGNLECVVRIANTAYFQILPEPVALYPLIQFAIYQNVY